MRKTKQVKQWAALIAAAAMVATMLPGMAQTAKAVGETGTFTLDGIVQTGTLIDSGYSDSGQKIEYKIIERNNGTRHLEFTGNGDMPNYRSSPGLLDQRWRSEEYNEKRITTVAFGKGITRIGDHTLYDWSLIDVEEIWLPEGLLEIGEMGLWNFNGSYLRIPSTVTSISYGALYRYKGTDLTLSASLLNLEQLNIWATNLHYPGTADAFKSNVTGGDANAAYERLEENNGFMSKDRNYGNYIEYVPFAPSDSPSPGNSFTDVKPGDYFYDAVNWAKDENITAGEDATHFGTGHPLNRAAAVTFIYAYDGGGNTSTNSGFSDVQSSDWFAKQVTWEVQRGVTSGVGGNRFDPYGTVTRAQAVQFLYNYTGGSVGTRASFSDVTSDKWFYNAVSWAVENNITSGTGNNMFSPDAPCLREQFVMLLYKLSQTR